MRPVGPAPTISTSAELGRDMEVLGNDLNAEKSCFGSHVYVQLGEKSTPAILRLNLKASCLPIYGCRIGMSCTVDTLIPHTCREPAKSMGFHRLWLVRISAHPLAPFGTHGASTSWAIGRVKYILWLTNMNVLPVTSNVYRTDIVLGICSLEWRLSAPRDLCTSL